MNFMCESAEFNGPICKQQCTRCAPAPKRWCIQIQERAEYNGLYPRDDWRAYRNFMVWPLTFATEAEAYAFLKACFTFKRLNGHKMSASTRLCGTKQRPAPGMHK